MELAGIADATAAFAGPFWDQLGLSSPCKSSKSRLPDAEITKGRRSQYPLNTSRGDKRNYWQAESMEMQGNKNLSTYIQGYKSELNTDGTV